MKQLGEMLCTWARCFISVKTSSILVLTFITSCHRKPYHTEKNNFIAKKKFNFSFEMSKQVEDGGLVLLVTFFLPTKKVRFWPLGNPFWCADKWGWDWKALLAGWPSLGAGTCSCAPCRPAQLTLNIMGQFCSFSPGLRKYLRWCVMKGHDLVTDRSLLQRLITLCWFLNNEISINEAGEIYLNEKGHKRQTMEIKSLG